MKFGFTIVLAAGFFVFLGCKPAAQNSKVKTLDEMASGKSGTYMCAASGGTPSQNVSRFVSRNVVLDDGTTCGDQNRSKQQLEYCSAVKDVLTAIDSKDPNLLPVYFETLGGQIKVSNQAVGALCQAAFSDQSSEQYVQTEYRKTISGCWSIAKLPDASGRYALVMPHKEDAAEIRRNGIRVFGMFFGQALQQMKKQGSSWIYDPNYSPEDSTRKNLWEKKKELASIFLSDIVAVEKAGKYSLDHLPLLSPLMRQKIRLGSTNVSVVITEKVVQQRFVDMVMGEAFDSGFCQAKENLAASQTSFKKSMAYFNSVVLGELQSLTSSLRGSTALASPSAPVSSTMLSGTQQSDQSQMNLSGGGFFGMLMGMFTGSANNSDIFNNNTFSNSTISNQNAPNFMNFASNGLSQADLSSALAGCSGGNCSCQNGQCSTCSGGCSGGNCSCPGGCCNCS